MKTAIIFARSFSGNDQKRMGRGALVACCCVIAFTLCTLVYGPLPAASPAAVKLVQSIPAADLKILQSREEISQPNIWPGGLNDKLQPAIIRNLSSRRSQVYELNGDVRIHGRRPSTIFLFSGDMATTATAGWITTKPYARNPDPIAMRKVTGLKLIIHAQSGPDAAELRCSRNFSLPAIVFSSGGYAGNPFHDFSDVLIPLFLTAQQFNREVVFLVADRRPWWTNKYKLILEKLSAYDVVDMAAAAAAEEVMCFPRMIVGLRAHKELSLDPSEPPHYSARDLTDFLRSTYSLHRQELVVPPGPGGCTRRPRLLIVSRKKTRRLMNAGEVAEQARRLGFEAVVSEMEGRVSGVARLVNAFDVMVGVHGAGLTNMLFLPANAVVIQIVPIRVEILARHYFRGPAEDMGLRYMEYRVRPSESSLPAPSSEQSRSKLDGGDGAAGAGAGAGGWHGFRAIYLDAQDIRLDAARFRETVLSRALEHVCGGGG
ncbi:alpha-1,3-arabinosyltransferase XAT2-like isoform X2 [Andrographis paniculata]|uniref:alpha-1,3-arabinosyltransferase XAT2-like isoform X2 n=1 Tax=Andrographis paniculata TaxID=175694 RepID=UPI0021E99460|nr:alpha-1,3-arabinosyltransferase XAT2-like isoform X2 [Andrographis paniculata]